MTQMTISPNGRTRAPAKVPEPDIDVTDPDLIDSDLTDPTGIAERRRTAAAPSVSPEVLVGRHVDNARRQLAEARERLKAARRRVVQLEDAVGNWERFAAELRNGRHNGPSPT